MLPIIFILNVLFTGKQSNISVTDLLNNQAINKKPLNKKLPLAEIQMNTQENKQVIEQVHVTQLKDTRNMATASSAGSVNTVISLNKFKQDEDSKNIPALIVTQHNLNANDIPTTEMDDVKDKRKSVRSRSPSSKSQSTLSTVQENYVSFKSNDSPLQNSKGKFWASLFLFLLRYLKNL